MDTAVANVHVVGIRHLSPGGARCIRAVLDRVNPTMVLIEGMADATNLIDDITAKSTKPPIAILAYTNDLPVRTLVSPFASYSPEFQALLWAREHDCEARFCDLPSDVFLAISDVKPIESTENEDSDNNDDAEDEGELNASQQRPVSPYDLIAKASGEHDYESYWERRFEHLTHAEDYLETANTFGHCLREIDHERPLRNAETLIREAYMRRCIHAAIDEGHNPGKIVVLCGAYHAPVINLELEPMSDEEFEQLPRRDSKLTLMPYSYFKLSSQSGYGAGNQAPAYYELVWDLRDEPERLVAEYCTRVAQQMRKHGTHRSCASVIEASRLAQALAAMSSAPTSLPDLQDSVKTLLGLGEIEPVADALTHINIGTAIGALADGVSQTAIQDDFLRQLSELNLSDYRSATAKQLQLDLRENRRVKTEAAAFRDLNRSSFLHRLRVLQNPFACFESRRDDTRTWAEYWSLKWTPEAEISLVEAVLLGETIEVAAAYALRQSLDDADSAAACARVVRQAGECNLPTINQAAVNRLQAIATESGTFTDLATALIELHTIRRYGDVRRIDPKPLEPLITQLYLQASLGLYETAKCDDKTAQSIMPAIAQVDEAGEACLELVDSDLWQRQLQRLSDSDELNPLLSGFACAILCERGLIDDDELAKEVSRRLSPGISADLGAGWFEGLSQRNRYALLTRLALWRQLAEYMSSLDDEQFKRALVFLRRAFSTFSPQEKRSIAENLGEIWGVNSHDVSELINEELNEEENQQLDELNDFDFDDL